MGLFYDESATPIEQMRDWGFYLGENDPWNDDTSGKYDDPTTREDMKKHLPNDPVLREAFIDGWKSGREWWQEKQSGGAASFLPRMDE